MNIKHSRRNQTQQQRDFGIMSGQMSQWENDLDSVAHRAWIKWVAELDLDGDTKAMTIKSARDAAANSYQDGITPDEWTAATLARLFHP